MKRAGRTLATIEDGHPRRLADGRNAWRKMNREQRAEFARFLAQEGLTAALADAGLPFVKEGQR